MLAALVVGFPAAGNRLGHLSERTGYDAAVDAQPVECAAVDVLHQQIHVPVVALLKGLVDDFFENVLFAGSNFLEYGADGELADDASCHFVDTLLGVDFEEERSFPERTKKVGILWQGVVRLLAFVSLGNEVQLAGCHVAAEAVVLALLREVIKAVQRLHTRGIVLPVLGLEVRLNELADGIPQLGAILN